MLRELKKNPHRVMNVFTVSPEANRFVLETEKGKRMIILASNYRTNDRYSNGSFAVDETETGAITQVWSETE